MKPQEIFDTVVNHLRKQGKRAFDENRGICVYRTHDGLKCAVGCLIQDEEYSPAMETWGSILGFLEHDDCPSALVQRFRPHGSLLQNLQRVHDEMNKYPLEGRLQQLAEAFKLVYTPPQG